MKDSSMVTVAAVGLGLVFLWMVVRSIPPISIMPVGVPK